MLLFFRKSILFCSTELHSGKWNGKGRREKPWLNALVSFDLKLAGSQLPHCTQADMLNSVSSRRGGAACGHDSSAVVNNRADKIQVSNRIDCTLNLWL